MTGRACRGTAALGLALLLAAGCRAQRSTALPSTLPGEAELSRIPLETPPGPPGNWTGATLANPFANDPAAAQEGKQFYAEFNCDYCHGADATGWIGPDLTDRRWRYGGTPAKVFKSIYEGRPKGMPAWGKMLTPDVVWKLVAYIQSLGGTLPDSAATPVPTPLEPAAAQQ